MSVFGRPGWAFGGGAGQDLVDEPLGRAGIDGLGAVELLDQWGDGLVVGPASGVQQLHRERAGCGVGPQARVGLQQSPRQGAHLRGLAEMRREDGCHRGLGPAGDHAQAVQQAAPGAGQRPQAELFRQLAGQHVRGRGTAGPFQARDVLLDRLDLRLDPLPLRARFRRALAARLRLPAAQPTGPGLQPLQAFPDLSRSRIHHPRAARDLLGRMLRERVETVFLAHPLEIGLLAPARPQQARDLLRGHGGCGS